MNLDTLTPDRKAYLKPFSPHARFEIPSEKKGSEYLNYLHGLISEMLTKADPRNRWNRVSFDQKSGIEGGIGSVYLGVDFIVGCKLYWYNGEQIDTPCGWQKGCLFRDHEDKSVYTVNQIFSACRCLCGISEIKRDSVYAECEASS